MKKDEKVHKDMILIKNSTNQVKGENNHSTATDTMCSFGYGLKYSPVTNNSRSFSKFAVQKSFDKTTSLAYVELFEKKLMQQILATIKK